MLDYHELSLNNGITKHNQAWYCKNDFGQVTLSLSVRKPDLDFAQNELIAVLPVGYRPKENIETSCATTTTSGYAAGTIQVRPNGNVVAYINAVDNVRIIHSSTIIFSAVQ